MNMYEKRQLYLEKELEEYEKVTPMTSIERELLHEWVADGNSVHENGCYAVWEGNTPIDFLDVYRWDKEERDTDAMTGRLEFSLHGIPLQEMKTGTFQRIQDENRRIRRELGHLWEFIWSEGLGEDAREFMNDHKDEETPFEWY